MALKCISECQTFYKAGHTTYYMLAMPLFACALDLPHDLGTLDASVLILDSMHSIFIRITIALKEKSLIPLFLISFFKLCKGHS